MVSGCDSRARDLSAWARQWLVWTICNCPARRRSRMTNPVMIPKTILSRRSNMAASLRVSPLILIQRLRAGVVVVPERGGGCKWDGLVPKNSGDFLTHLCYVL